MSFKDYLIFALIIGLSFFIYLNDKNQNDAEVKYKELIIKHEYSKDSLLKLNDDLHLKNDSLDKENLKLKIHEKELENDKNSIKKKYHEKYKAIDNADGFQLDSLIRSYSGFGK